ncbi:MAG TPA: ABC transporter permease [Terriglobales bacterium]|jgi:peptide/nickel transport system permease protein
MLLRLGRRLAAALITVLAALVLCFALAQLTPGDAFSALELDPAIAPAELAHLRAEYLPQQSLPQRLAAWLEAAVHGDLGVSLESHRPVLSLLRQRIPASAELLALGLAGAWGLGLTLALLPAWLGETGRRRGRRIMGGGFHAAASLLTSLPLGVLAILALVWAPVGWLPQPGSGTAPWLAALVLGLAFLPTVYFQAAQTLAEVAERGFLQQGRALGFSPARLWLRHALPNAADVLVPVASLTVSQALIELVVLEPLLGWPGLGQLSLQAAQSRDMPVLAALVLLSSLVVIAANLASDLLQAWLNPQLRPARRLAAGNGGA